MNKNAEIKEFINRIIEMQYEMDEGKEAMSNALQKFFPSFNTHSLKSMDFNRVLVEFENWLVSTITQDPMPSPAKSIWFCHFDNSVTEGIPGPIPEMQLIMTASKYSPNEKPIDWFVNKIWEPQGKQSELKAYKTLSNSLKSFEGELKDLVELLFNSLSTLLIINGFDIIKHEFLGYQTEISLACGGESNGYFLIGKLTEDGVVHSYF